MPKGLDYYIQRNEYLENELLQSRHDNLYLQAQIDQLKRLIFGAKSERFIAENNPEQMLLALGAEAAMESITSKATAVEAHQRGGQKTAVENKPSRSALPADLPRVETIIEPKEDIANSKKIGEEITEILELELPKLVVQRIIRPKYLQPDGSIVIGKLPSRPIEKGMAGPKLLAHVVISKYVDHLPIYRQVKQFKRWGIELPESTIYGWITGTCKLMEPLYECLKKKVLASNYLQADESPMPVLTEEKKGQTHRGYMWVYHSPPRRLVLFDYRPGRGQEGPKELLRNFKGFLQTDGYAVYDQFETDKNITLVGCMAHARRYFDQALNNDRETAEYMMQRFAKLYDLERRMRQINTTDTEIIENRIRDAVPVLEEMNAFMKAKITQVTPQSTIGKAIGYALPRWEKLSIYTQHAELNIDNNLVENQIRPIALGRKNYLFAGSHDGAQRSAMLYSFLGTCKLNGVDPQQWLTETLQKLPDTKLSELHSLLPTTQN
jgi:transposase